VSITTTTVPVIGLQEVDSSVSYTPLQRTIIYAEINDFCSEKITGSTSGAIQDFSETCSLTKSEVRAIKQSLAQKGILISEADLALFAQAYKDRNIFQSTEDKRVVEDFNLFISAIGIIGQWQLSPPSIDTPVLLLNVPEGESTTLTRIITSSKELKSCEVISNTPQLTCTVTTNSIKIEYLIESVDFFSEVFTGRISVVTAEDQAELREITVTLRAFNGNFKLGGVPVKVSAPLVVGGGILWFLRRRGFKSFTNLIKLS